MFQKAFRQTILLGFSFLFATKSIGQSNGIVHEGVFRRAKLAMSSRHYSPDDWEKPYFDAAIKSVFPSALKNHPDEYNGKLIHLLGVVDSVYFKSINDTLTAFFLLENKFWDYVEDYSVQDEVMFVSPKGDGKFAVAIQNVSPAESVQWASFSPERKLFLVYGNFQGLLNGVPLLAANAVKAIDYKFYSTNIFSYDYERSADGTIEVDKKGRPKLADFKVLKIAKAGQNKD